MKRFQWVVLAVVVLAVGSGGFLLKTIYDAGEFRKIEPHFSGNCGAVEGVLSSEDMCVGVITGSCAPDEAVLQKTQSPGVAYHKFLA